MPVAPAKGQFILRPMANPPLKAGDYTLAGQVRLDKKVPDPARPGDPPKAQPLGPVQRADTHIRVTSPRYVLPPDQMLSCFPPANSVGAYENRLPQIVIKRRTLPWEREPVAGDTTTPWLALVVIAEGEATLSGEQPVAQCVTPGVAMAGPNDVATGVCLQVTEGVVNQVFPKREELALLCHVRQVDVNDTELANGDDDGFLAVVIANRLPQFDRTNNKPVRYLACLINVEGQLDHLAKPPPPVLNFLATTMVFDYRLVAGTNAKADPDWKVMGGKAQAGAGLALAARAPAGGPKVQDAAQAAEAARLAPRSQGAAAAGQAAHWQTTTARIENVALTAAHHEAGRMVRDGMLEGYRGNLGQLFQAERIFRFPVLAHWSFTVDGVGGFESLMRDLDVAMLGTDPSLPAPGQDPRPPANVAVEPPTRPPAEVGPAGHVGLPHLTRHGDKVKAWYRGPLTPFPTTRDAPDGQGKLTIAHVSDQLRRSVPDGREDLSLAAAFEIGRLLALSQPSVVRGLMAWRGEQFGAARARLQADAFKEAPVIKGLLAGAQGSLADLLARHTILAAAARPDKVLAPTRPLAVPGRELPYAREGGLDRLISEGFGFSAAQVKKLREGTGTVAALKATPVPLAQSRQDEPVLEGPEAQRLQAALDAKVDRLTADAVGTPGIGPRDARARRGAAATPRAPDALDEVLARATRARRR